MPFFLNHGAANTALDVCMSVFEAGAWEASGRLQRQASGRHTRRCHGMQARGDPWPEMSGRHGQVQSAAGGQEGELSHDVAVQELGNGAGPQLLVKGFPRSGRGDGQHGALRFREGTG